MPETLPTPVLVLGGAGLIGSALVRALGRRGLAGSAVQAPMHRDLDAADPAALAAWLATHRPRSVIVAAALVGGIAANRDRPWDFIERNLAIALAVTAAARQAAVPRLLYLASSCVYPRDCPQPMREEHLLSGPLEPTNSPYAMAKLAGIELVHASNRQHGTDWLSVLPTNLYGPGDNFDLAAGHVLPALIRRFTEAADAGHAPVTLWGSGTPRREFLHADDAAEGCLHLLEHAHAGQAPRDAWNLGSGAETTITDLATLVQRAVGHRGAIHWDRSQPDGTPRKLLDLTRLNALGWQPRRTLADGVAETCRWYREHRASARC
jgi:nucleoside-diphosphate-sugar epimerase